MKIIHKEYVRESIPAIGTLMRFGDCPIGGYFEVSNNGKPDFQRVSRTHYIGVLRTSSRTPQMATKGDWDVMGWFRGMLYED